MKRLLQIGEILAARILPGFLNLMSILVLGAALGSNDYGRFSLILSTSAFLGLLATGPIRFGIIPRHSEFAIGEESRRFEASLLGGILVVVALVCSLGTGLVLLGVADVSWLVLFAVSSFFTTWQPVQRARLQFWLYGATANVQAGLQLLIVYFVVRPAPEISLAIWAFAVSYGAGFLVGWVMCGAPMPRLPDRAMMRSVLGVGSAFTVSGLAEDLLYLGTRYAILWFGSAGFLGTFSYAVDLAQRSVGVVINVASFAIVPRAYHAASNGKDREFREMLLRGALVAGTLSGLVLAAIIGMHAAGLLEALTGTLFSLVAFVAVSIAVAINRLKKLVIDPFLVRKRAHFAIPRAYAIVAPCAFVLAVAVLLLGRESLVLIIYPLAYVCVSLLSVAAYLRRAGA